MAQYRLDDTIAAIATPIGEGGISVIRVSGPDAFQIVDSVFRSSTGRKINSFESHTIHVGHVITPKGEKVDQALLSIFKKPHSYTGEDVLEISSHGGIMITKKILEVLNQSGTRHAEPGEFTKRAFLNGRIDLTQAEAVLDLIQARSQQSLEVALRQLEGSLSGKLKKMKENLLGIYAHMEAYLDFPEDDIEAYGNQEFAEKFSLLKKEMESLIASFQRAAILREGVTIVIVGKPNVGKSSLFNALLERDRALVSPYPGTTRDHLEEFLEIGGILIRLIDTAGLASTLKHPLDKISMEHTRQTLNQARICLFLLDASENWDVADQMTFQELPKDKPFLIVANKCDLKNKMNFSEVKKSAACDRIVEISTQTRQGLDALEKAIMEILTTQKITVAGEQITRLRHRNGLEAARNALQRAEKGFAGKASLEFVTIELKAALEALNELVGEVYSDDLLEVIFSEFCIGK